jgi:hydroxymethylpyrimidine kinase / phosphomethylpyrimidine kinase / thiamine-phosphate diphosphorylase
VRRVLRLKVDKKDMLLYAVTDRTWIGNNSLEVQVEEAIKGGATFIQLREKELTFDEFVEVAKQVKAVTSKYKVPFVINDNLDVALAVNADGVHIGQEDGVIKFFREKLGVEKIIGVSVHNPWEAIKAQEEGADYIGVGAVFHTSTKVDANTLNFKTVNSICQKVQIPVVAIGGISKYNIDRLSGSGVDGVAVVSGIFAQADIRKAASELKKKAIIMVNKNNMKTVLTIAGSDSSGGAGIQADIKTIISHRLYATSVITALTAQNTTGVYGVCQVNPDFVAQQLDAVFTDIYPDAIKIGMVLNTEIIAVIVEKLREYQGKNIVVDPVMISTSGSDLLKADAMKMLIEQLIPLATVITPNIAEAQRLSDLKIETKKDMEKAAIEISKKYAGDILIKGGHLKDCSDDLLYTKGSFYWYEQENINNYNTHGTGCTLSSAVACNLAIGKNVQESVLYAKQYITGALKANLDLGKGSSPLNHAWNQR